MDAGTRDLALFAALSLFCAGAWIVDHVISFQLGLLVLGVAAIVGAIEQRLVKHGNIDVR